MALPTEFLLKLNMRARLHVKTSLPISSLHRRAHSNYASVCQPRPTGDEETRDEFVQPMTNCRCKLCTNSSVILFVLPIFGPSMGLQIVIGVHFAVEVSVVDYAITNVITTDRHINDKVVRANKTKVHKLDIALLIACGRRRRHLVVDAHRVACVAGQLRQDIHDMIVASGGSRVLFANKHVIALRIKRKVLTRAHGPSNSMRLKHRDRRAHGSAEEAHPQVQTEASDRSLSRHVSRPRKRAQVQVPSLLLFSRRCRNCRRSVGVDSVCLQKVFMENSVPIIFWNCWDPLQTLKFQIFFTPCKRDMSNHILMMFPTLHEVRSSTIRFPEPLQNAEAKRLLRTHKFVRLRAVLFF